MKTTYTIVLKKLFLLSIVAFFIVLLFSPHIKQESVAFSEKQQPEQQGCPVCKEKYLERTDSTYYKYAKTVERAADKLKADSITNKEYKEACDKARLIRDKASAVYRSEFQKCCLKETRKNYDNQKGNGRDSKSAI